MKERGHSSGGCSGGDGEDGEIDKWTLRQNVKVLKGIHILYLD